MRVEAANFVDSVSVVCSWLLCVNQQLLRTTPIRWRRARLRKSSPAWRLSTSLRRQVRYYPTSTRPSSLIRSDLGCLPSLGRLRNANNNHHHNTGWSGDGVQTVSQNQGRQFRGGTTAGDLCRLRRLCGGTPAAVQLQIHRPGGGDATGRSHQPRRQVDESRLSPRRRGNIVITIGARRRSDVIQVARLLVEREGSQRQMQRHHTRRNRQGG